MTEGELKCEMGLKTWAPNGRERTVEPHPEIGVEGLPGAGERAVCIIKKSASRGPLTTIIERTNRIVLVAKFCLARFVWTNP